ncbi:MAG: DUF3795 domain-containing protein [Chloroflexi bacterium]|nr:DUF3795 domain-containing protein [Chloroflexota bacterium]
MTQWTDPATLAFCGWICAGCPGLSEGCAGCRAGGGDAGCPTRDCPSERGYAGCWECAEFPCDRGPFGRPDFGGTTIAYVRAAQRIGVPAMLERARAALGDQIDYSALQNKTEEEVLALLGLG